MIIGGSGLLCVTATEAESLADSSDQTLDEIIVTSQKYAQRLVEVPISVSVLSTEELNSSAATSLTDVLENVPGVEMQLGLQGNQSVISLRGVGAPGVLFGGASTVGYYIDSAPFAMIASAALPDMNPYDLERVEVLRGPQGVLYGAASLDGTVRVLTHDPELGKWALTGRSSGSYTEDGRGNYRDDLAVNIPLVGDVVAARVVAGYEHLSGWIDRPNQDDTNSSSLTTLRLKLRAHPTEDLDLGASLWHSRDSYADLPSGYTSNKSSFSLAQPADNGFDTYSFRALRSSHVTPLNGDMRSGARRCYQHRRAPPELAAQVSHHSAVAYFVATPVLLLSHHGRAG